MCAAAYLTSINMLLCILQEAVKIQLLPVLIYTSC